MFDSAERLAGIFPGEIANHTDFSLNAWPEVAFASAKKSGIMVSAFIAEAFPGPLVPVAKRTGARGAELLLPVSAMRYKEYNNFQADAIAAFIRKRSMSRFREGKKRFAAFCAAGDWKQTLQAEISDASSARGALNPLLALLPWPELRLRAAYGLGLAVSLLAKEDKEAARVFMRRLLWSLNEESGNLGWGVPEAMGAILAESPALVREYGRIFLSYGLKTGREDNFLDHPPLRVGLYQGIGRLAASNAAAARPALPCLAQALGEEDRSLRGMAAFALRELVKAAPGGAFSSGRAVWREAETGLARALAAERAAPGPPEMLTVFDGEREERVSVEDMLAQALSAVRRRLAP